MRGYVTIDTESQYNIWLDEQAEYINEEDDDDDWQKLDGNIGMQKRRLHMSPFLYLNKGPI